MMPRAGRKGNPLIGKISSTAVPPRHLADMRSVWERDDFENDTPAQRELRAMKLKDFEGFLEKLNKYELQYKEDVRKGRADKRAANKAARETRVANAALAAKVKAESPEVAVKKGPDAGTMCALELIEKILREAE